MKARLKVETNSLNLVKALRLIADSSVLSLYQLGSFEYYPGGPSFCRPRIPCCLQPVCQSSHEKVDLVSCEVSGILGEPVTVVKAERRQFKPFGASYELLYL